MNKTCFVHRIRSIFLVIMAIAIITCQEYVAPKALAAPTEDVDAQEVTIQMSAEDYKFYQLFTSIRDLIEEYYPKGIDSSEIYQGALKGVLESLDDPYSQYMNQEQLDSLSSSLEGEYSGVGITIDLINGGIVVVGSFRGSPAEKAGIQPGDVIIRINNNDMSGKVPSDASILLRGAAGTEVDVTVNRPHTGETFTYKITREIIRPRNLSLTELGDGLCVIEISQFTADIARQFPVVMNYLRSRGLRGLILDVRDNPGGLLDSALALANELVPKGPIVELRRRELKQVMENPNDIIPVPVVVVVNGGSASASEILAGAIRDRGVGILVGSTTFGKACVQAIIPFDEGQGGMKLTIADYYTPSGYSLADRGLEPDIEANPVEMDIPTVFQFKRPITSGLVGLDVLALQESLRFLGYNVGESDGVCGARTIAAITAFLHDQHLDDEGSFGQIAAIRLDKTVEEKILDLPDSVLDTAINALKTKLATGTWQ